MTMRDDGVVTIRDIYALVQQVNTRTTELMHQVDTLNQRAREDRRQAAKDREDAEELAEEMGKLKIKIYTAVATATTLMSILVVLGQIGVTFG